MLARKMRLSDFCNRLTTRAPCTLPDSRSRSLFCPVAFQRLSTPWTTDHSGSRMRVELRLTATLQLQLCHNRPGVSRGRSPDPRLKRAPRRSGRASIESSSALCLPTAALSTARRACSLASGILLHDHPARPDLSIRSALTAAGLRLRRRLVKDSRVVETRTPSLDECALPCSAWPRSPLARPRETGVTGSSRTRHRTHDFAAVGRLRTSSSPFESPRGKPHVNR